MDEVYVKAGLKGGRRISSRRKGPFLVVVSRDGYEDYIPLTSMESSEIGKVVAGRICRRSTIMTDEYRSYEVLDELGYKHEAVKHSIGNTLWEECI